MKSRIRPYTQFLIKENMPYLILAVVLVLATAGITFFAVSKFDEMDTNIKNSREELNKLSNKRASLKTVAGESTENLDNDLQLITTLIPDTEDYFSIIIALERLSQQTGFRVDSYTINLLSSNATKLNLTVMGTGNNQSFLEFLKNYQLNGGRLITVENIGIDPQQTGGIRLDLNFYNKKASADAGGSVSAGTSLKELDAIRSKVSFSLQNAPNDTSNIGDYPTKPNPF